MQSTEQSGSCGRWAVDRESIGLWLEQIRTHRIRSTSLCGGIHCQFAAWAEFRAVSGLTCGTEAAYSVSDSQAASKREECPVEPYAKVNK